MTCKAKLLLYCGIVNMIGVGHAEVALDGSLGPAGAISLHNGTYLIDSSAGQLVGSNLFHSFSRFNVESDAMAHFADSTRQSIANVIARVTGGEASRIDGTIKSSIAGADLYLINPAGLLFGPEARLDVPGSFHASTAAGMHFEDGGYFNAVQPGNDVLTTAPPQAFGFLDTVDSRAIEVNGSALGVPNGNKLDMAAGQIHIDDSAVLYAPAGEIRLVAVQGSQEVVLQHNADAALPLPMQSPTAENSGDITIRGNSDVDFGGLDTSGDGGGRIAVWGGDILLKNGLVDAVNEGSRHANAAEGIEMGAISLDIDNVWVRSIANGEGHGGAVRVESVDTLALANGAQISSEANAGGQAGPIRVKAGSLTIDRQESPYPTGIRSLVWGEGDAADVRIESEHHLDIINGGTVLSGSFGDGKAASLFFEAGGLKLDKQQSQHNTGIISLTSDQGTGAAGSIDILSGGWVQILNGAFITSSTLNASDSSSITLQANALKVEGLDANGGSSSIFTLASAGSLGQGGNVDIVAKERVDILDGGLISTDTEGVGRAGDVTIQADALTIRGLQDSGISGIYSSAKTDSLGSSGNVTVYTRDETTILRGGKIDTATFSRGDAGHVSVDTGQLTIDRQQAVYSDGTPVLTGISTRAYAESGGQGGDVTVTARGRVAIAGGQISSTSFGTKTAGTIEIEADDIALASGGSINAGAFGSGDGGSITARSRDLTLHDGASLYTRTYGQPGGNAGAIRLDVDNRLSITEGAVISSSSSGSGDAGTIDVAAGTIVVDDRDSETFTGISTEALYPFSGSGGAMTIKAEGEVTVSGLGGTITTSTASSKPAGAILLTADKIALIDQGRIAATTTGGGQGGDIRIEADELTIDGAYRMLTGIDSASLGTGAAGNIAVQANSVLLSKLGYISTDSLASGNAGFTEIRTQRLDLFDGGYISSIARGEGQAGNIYIGGIDERTAAQDVVIQGLADHVMFELPDGREVKGNASGIYLNTSGSGRGGSLDMKTDRLIVADGGVISAVTYWDATSETQGGNIDIHAGTVDLTGGALVSTSTSGVGKAGSIAIVADDSLSISGYFDRSRHADVTNPRWSDRSGISSGASYFLDPTAQSLGSGGSISVSTRALNMSDGAEISAINRGTREAGTIDVSADSVRLSGHSAVTVESAQGNAGDIKIQSGNLMYLLNSWITTSAAEGLGNGGNIAIKQPAFTVLNGSRIVADAVRGNGGNISISTDFFLPSTESVVSASSEFGLQGTISIQSQVSNIANSIGVLSGDLLDVSNLLYDTCAAAVAHASTFTVVGRGSLPLSPDNPMFQGLQSLQCGSGI